MITIQRITAPSEVSLADINALLPQLRSDKSEHTATQADIDRITSGGNIVFVAAKDGAKVAGMATAYLVPKIGKTIAYVEDVVVDESYRGQKLGKRLMEALIGECRQSSVTAMYLTSKAERAAANALYQKLGFELRPTNNYRLKL